MEYKATINKVIIKISEKKKEEDKFASIKVEKDTVLYGVICSIGLMVPVDTGLKAGDEVMFSAYGYEEVYDGDDAYAIVDYDNIYGKRIL